MAKHLRKIIVLSVLLFNFGILEAAKAIAITTDTEFDGLQPFHYNTSTCEECGLYIRPQSGIPWDARVLAFVNALETEKQTLMSLYSASSQDYNLLAHMAMGILGRESNFFQSGRYQLKETFPWLVRGLKIVEAKVKNKNLSPNSRGPTQIKTVPDLIAQHYQIQSEELANPESAAVATMGFLIEALTELRNRAKNNNLDFITPETYVDYLPYIYFGQSKAISNRTATPEKNLYVRSMKNHMKKFELFEVHF